MISSSGIPIKVQFVRKWALLPNFITWILSQIYGKIRFLSGFEFRYIYNDKSYTTLKIGYDLDQFIENEDYTAIINTNKPDEVKIIELMPKIVIYNIIE